jgi:hypothetical protein
MSESERVVLLAQDGDATRAVYHALAGEFPDLHVMLEEPVTRVQLLRRRAVRLGWPRVIGQLLFVSGVVPVLRWRGRKRIKAIGREYGLDHSPLPEPILRVTSVNSEQCREALRRLRPDVVVINGTRIIDSETLATTQAPYINMHAGITPLYRGVHGGYWALAEARADLVGTTIHRVDEGIDTGKVLDQVFFTVTSRDNFATYPYLHTAHGIPRLVEAVRRALDGKLRDRDEPLDLPSKLRTHPTAWTYLRARATRGVN